MKLNLANIVIRDFKQPTSTFDPNLNLHSYLPYIILP